MQQIAADDFRKYVTFGDSGNSGPSVNPYQRLLGNNRDTIVYLNRNEFVCFLVEAAWQGATEKLNQRGIAE